MNHKKAGFLIFFIYLIINLIILKDYGLSWDYHYHYYAGLYHLGLKVPPINQESKIPFSSPDPRLTTEDPFGPFTQIIPSLSQIIFSENLKLLPPDISYNLPMVIFGSLGVLVLYLFLLEAFNFEIAFVASLVLALNPVYFGYLHNNMKDIPNSFAFTLAVWFFWRLVKYKNMKSLLLAVIAFAFAFNIKINSVLIPVICGLYFLITGNRKLFKRNNMMVLSYFLLAPVFALVVWWPFWSDPLVKLRQLPEFYSLNTINMPVLLFGKIFRSGVNIPPAYPYLYLAVTTPLPVLILSLLGLIVSVYFSFRKNNNFVLLILWFFVPLLRYLSPKTGAIDGVRHFMEVLAPLSVFAAIGLNFLIKRINRNLSYLIGIFIFAFIIFILVRFHPYQTSFFNSLAGGIQGAQGKFDIDFWGTPQKAAVLWLNENAPRNSSVYIIMAQSTASVYLRPDLQGFVNRKSITDSDYLVLLNRQSFFNLYGINPDELSQDHELIFSEKINGVPLVWIFRRKAKI